MFQPATGGNTSATDLKSVADSPAMPVMATGEIVAGKAKRVGR